MVIAAHPSKPTELWEDESGILQFQHKPGQVSKFTGYCFEIKKIYILKTCDIAQYEATVIKSLIF